jgi:hypothetical protein
VLAAKVMGFVDGATLSYISWSKAYFTNSATGVLTAKASGAKVFLVLFFKKEPLS